jgi:hypothetical protein
MQRCLVASLCLAALAGCGGGGKTSTLTDAEQGKLAESYTTVTGYCIAQIQQNALGQGTGGSLGQVAEAVDTAVSTYKSHEPDAEVRFTPVAPKQTLRHYMRSLETTLGKGDCASDQAQKVDKALAGN